MAHKEQLHYTRTYLNDERHETAREALKVYKDEGIAGAKKTIEDFYRNAAELAEEDARAFNVRMLAEEQGVVLVSAIRTYGTLGPFRPQNRKDFKGVRLFDILLRPNQIACCSSVTEGDTSNNLYGNWGVIVGEGTVHQAYPHDATSSVTGGVLQSKFSTRMSGMRPSEQMHLALRARPSDTYNEINTTLGGIAGIFYCIDGDDSDGRDLPSDAFQSIIKPLDIPQYILRDGTFFLMTDAESQETAQCEAVSPSDILKTSIRPTQAQRDVMINYLTETLTLAPRNSITSGVARGHFAYDYHQLTPHGRVERFFKEHRRMTEGTNESLRLYGAMALYAFAEAAEEHDSMTEDIARARLFASAVLSLRDYNHYKTRILPSGNLTVTEDDLRHYLETEELPAYLKDH